MISGVAQVQVYGSQKYAVRIQVDPQALASRGIGIDEVAQAIQSANVNLPTGTLYGSHQAVHRTGQRPADERRGLPAADRRLRNGAPVRLEEVGRVLDSVENDKVAGWVNGQRAVMLAIQRQPGTNTVEVVDSDRAHAAGVPRRSCRPRSKSRISTIARGFDPRFGQRRAVHAAADRLPGRDGDLPVPAQPLRHDHSERSRCRCRSSAPSR